MFYNTMYSFNGVGNDLEFNVDIIITARLSLQTMDDALKSIFSWHIIKQTGHVLWSYKNRPALCR